METERNCDTPKSFKYVELSFNVDDAEISIHYVHRFNTHDAIPIKEEADTLKPSSGKLHKHPFFEMFFCTDLGISVDTGGEILELSRGDVLIIPPKHEHTIIGTGASVTSINFSFLRNKLYRRGGLFDILTSITSAPFLHLTDCNISMELLEKYYGSLDFGRVLMVSRYFHDIISEVINAATEIPQITFADMLPDTDIRRHRSIEALIDRHYTENLTLEFLAKKLNLSTRHTSRTIKAKTGKTLGELVLARRMAAAMQYLTESDLSVSAIAAAVGYNSQTCFYNAFTKYYGRLPSEVRRASTEKQEKI